MFGVARVSWWMIRVDELVKHEINQRKMDAIVALMIEVILAEV